MTTDAIPVLHVADAQAAAEWYRRLGFVVEFEHRFEPDFPAYVGVRREGAQLHLSEHAGDAPPHTLVYLWVEDVDAVAAEFGAAVDEQPWAREVSLSDPDGNRLRVATPAPERDVDRELGAGTVAAWTSLEGAMWREETRGDRSWMEEHLATDFTEFGYSGRAYTTEMNSFTSRKLRSAWMPPAVAHAPMVTR